MHVFTGAAATGQSLIGCGVVAYNPPFTLAGEARSLLPVLARRMAVGADARAAVFNIGAQN
jgi:23S rRNA A2030 N6-methylase RlmJ